MKKVLYFEGAGWFGADTSKATDVGNCRIRTAFTNNDGKKIYLEMIACQINKYNKKTYPLIKNVVGFVDACFYITGDRNDCNSNRVPDIERKVAIEFTKENVLNLINSKLNCSFDEIITLPNLAGYQVFKHSGGYNFGDEFVLDEKLLAQREKIYQYFYNFEKNILGKRFPNFSCWVNEKGGLSLIIHYNCYNDRFDIDDVYNYDFNYKMPDDEILKEARERHGVYSNKKTVGGKI